MKSEYRIEKTSEYSYFGRALDTSESACARVQRGRWPRASRVTQPLTRAYYGAMFT